MNLDEETKAGLWIGAVFLGVWMVLWALTGDFFTAFMWAVGLWIALVLLFNMAIHFAGTFRR